MRIVRSAEALRELQPAWASLDAVATLPSQQFDWLEAAATTLTHPENLYVVCTEDGRGLSAMMALVADAGYLKFLGHDLFDPAAPSARDPALFADLACALSDLPIPLRLDRVPAQTFLSPVFSREIRNHAAVIVRPDQGWLAVDLGAPVDPGDLYPDGPSVLRKKRRRAETWGEIRFVALEPTVDQLPALWETTLHLEAAGWKGTAGTALSHDSRRGAFYRRYAEAACRNRHFRLFFLYFGERPAAMQMAVEWKQRLWLLKTGYDEQFARCSPGNLLLHEIVQYAQLRHLASIELMGVSEPYKKRWANAQRDCHVVRAYPWKAGPMYRLAGDLVRAAWSRFELAA